MTIRPKVALSQDFLLTISKLPPAIYSKVLKWTMQFQTQPMSNGINYEKILNSADPNLKSVRIDQDYRGIVFKPEREDVYVLLHVDKHDEAYRWAERRKLSIHPITGSLQVLMVESVGAPTLSVAQLQVETGNVEDHREEGPLFNCVSTEDLIYFGISPELVERVLALKNITELDELRPSLDIEAYESLVLLTDGFSVQDVRDDIGSRQAVSVQPNDFAASLDTDESRSAFYVVENEQELSEVLNAPLAQWRIFLHPKQKRLATLDASGPMRVLGGAGTGKTVLAMHRVRWLAENRTLPKQKVLFTTFTRNLAGDIQANLETLCSRETLGKIEVINLDKWVKGYLSGKLYEHRIQYELWGDAKPAWEKAMTLRDTRLELPDDFYVSEWEQVVSANGIGTLDEYRTARRQGRGDSLRRKERDAIWPVFEEFRSQLSARKLKMVDDAYRDAASLLVGDPPSDKYSAIVVDETQDLGPMALRLLRQMIPSGTNDLFFVGDGHQRIYKRHRAAMRKCGINIVGRSRKLNLNYRTTDEIRRAATHLLDGYPIDDLDDGLDSSRGYTSLSHGPAPDVQRLENLDRAVDAVTAGARAWTLGGDENKLSQCIIAPNQKIRNDIAASLTADKLPTLIIEADNRDKGDSNAIRLATMHRAKGLEFDRVTVVVSKSVLDGPDAEETERKMLYVALTRAKREARIVAY